MAFPVQFDLADLDGSNGFVLNGIYEYEDVFFRSHPVIQ